MMIALPRITIEKGCNNDILIFYICFVHNFVCLFYDNNCLMSDCHLCKMNQLETKIEEEVFVARCCIRRCNKKYCLGCIREKFSQVSIMPFRSFLPRCTRLIPGYAMHAKAFVIVCCVGE